jgi:dihydroflavonol-4-reductase
MNNVLVTGATSFLGYHVAKRLNHQGIRPRVLELAGSNDTPLRGLDVERCAGHLDDAAAIAAACAGVDTLVHTAFKVSVSGGAALVDEMRRINVAGTERLLETANAHGVSRAVVTGSALAVGVNRRAQTLNESADPVEHAFDFPYAMIRKQAEQISLARARPGFAVMSVAPAFTLGPDDPVGAPANKLVKALMAGKLPVTLPVGFGCLDVRDFASGALLAADRGASGQRYLLSGDNVTTRQFLDMAAEVAGVKAPRLQPPVFLLKAAVAAVEAWSALRGRPAPVTRAVLQIIGRYAWYDTTRARTELGWTSRPLRETLQDTVRWLREHGTKNEELRTKNGTKKNT